MSQMIDPNQIVSVHPKTGRTHVETINVEPSLTQQQFKDECDINNILKKYVTTGEFTHKTSKTGIFSDFTEIQDYQGMLNTVIYAQDAFASLPAEMRLKFQNNPGNLLEFLQDDKNYDEGVKLGLINPKPETSNQTPKNEPNETPPNQTPKTKPKIIDPQT